MKTKYNITIDIGISPSEFDLAIVSLDKNANLGALNRMVLKSYGYSLNTIKSIDTSKGYDYLFSEMRKPILFVVTIGEGNSIMSLRRNLKNAIKDNIKLLEEKNIWIPLMGTGAAGLELVHSYNATLEVLKLFPKLSFTISIPEDKRGLNFIEEFEENIRTKTEIVVKPIKRRSVTPPVGFENVEENELEEAIEGAVGFNPSNESIIYEDSKSSSNSTTKERFNLLPLIKDILNQEYSFNLMVLKSALVYSINNEIDLIDESKNVFAVLYTNREKIITEEVSELNTETESHRKMSVLYSEIVEDVELLQSNDLPITYFCIFDNSFTKNDIDLISNWSSNNRLNYNPIPLRIDYIFELAKKHNIKLEDYDLKDIGNPQKQNNEASNDKIPFQLDQIVNEDKLGRDPVAKAFVDLIKKDVFTEKLNHSFIVHLQGKWGAGKSSFLNFVKNNLNAGKEQWVIVEYNAWQNQHMSPPWWSLIDQVYLKSRAQLNGLAYFQLWRKEVFRRIWRYSGWQKIIAFILFSLSIICILFFGEDIINIFNETTAVIQNGKDISKKSVITKLGDFGKLILTISSLLGILYGLTKFVTIPFFINSSKDAESFVLKASDPMNQVKKHFNDLVDDINKEKKRQLAIFIDDIDRCNKEYVVCLLEGIQTLFRDKRVLYIVAGDKNWITTSFANTYEEFESEDIGKNQLGELFIEKAFQLSFRLSNISEESKQNYWNHILGMQKENIEPKVSSIKDLTEDKQKEIKSVLRDSKSELTNPKFVQNIQDRFNLTEDTASTIVIEEKNKDTEELRHLLQEYHAYIDTNPRSIIRLANNYTMARSILIAERVAFDEHMLFRWLVIEDLCPKVKKIINTVQDILEFKEIINANNDLVKRQNCIKLLEGDGAFIEGEIKIEDIKSIKGL
ncbi:P-loop NTPase fold protein [Flavivirga abyssicola]|uniref:KAP family P-loop NTPase fold protein n=1 Tax=Flavivirga abyssicola TaxID=3063533 RepID=UPI0026E0E729|nr:P-loop NTPase fold protein [Flavivirga sp. MEBiC07777]WVK12673.1 P-loop NTPase fold protein [Flavivirga sp. MEBiC07777]